MEQFPPPLRNAKSSPAQSNTPQKNGFNALHRMLSPISKSRPLEKKGGDQICNQSTLFKYALNHTTMKIETETCSCPHILIADDDSFQHLYYQSLFQKSLDFEGIFVSRENLRVQLFYSGEELLENYNEIQKCGCNELMMVITDYQMGERKMNGVDTCSKLRNVGYKATLLLRTSESFDDLQKNHSNFQLLIQTNVIDALLEKSNIKGGKEIIQSFMNKASTGKLRI